VNKHKRKGRKRRKRKEEEGREKREEREGIYDVIIPGIMTNHKFFGFGRLDELRKCES